MKRFFYRLGMICKSKLFLFLVGSVLVVMLIGMTNVGLKGITRYLDIPTFILMLLPQLLYMYVTGLGKAFLNGFRIAFSDKEGVSRMELQMAVKAISFSGKVAIITSVIIAMIGFVSILYTMCDLTTLGPAISVMSLSILYAAMLMLFLTPVQMKLENKVISYMEDKDGQEAEEDAGLTLFFKLRAIGLTDREAEVARLVSCGMSNKEIGQILYISDTTVKKHVTHILEKTKCGDREELTEKIKGV